MMEQVFSYTGGHTCGPNGVGDYKFMCPETGDEQVGAFVPFMYRSILRGPCPRCGEAVRLEEVA